MTKWRLKNKAHLREYQKKLRLSKRPPITPCTCGNTTQFKWLNKSWVCRPCSSNQSHIRKSERGRIRQLKERMAQIEYQFGTHASTCYFNYAYTHKGCGALGPFRIHTLCLPHDWQKSPPNTLERIYLLNRILNLPFGNIGWHCQKCRTQSSEPKFFDIDHIHPRHKGGHGRIENLQVLCPNCHRKKTVFDVYSKPVQLELKTFQNSPLVNAALTR